MRQGGFIASIAANSPWGAVRIAYRPLLATQKQRTRVDFRKVVTVCVAVRSLIPARRDGSERWDRPQHGAVETQITFLETALASVAHQFFQRLEKPLHAEGFVEVAVDAQALRPGLMTLAGVAGDHDD